MSNTITPAARRPTGPMTGWEYVTNPTACPYCRHPDTRQLQHPHGHACNACNGGWSDVYRGDALVGYDPQLPRSATPRQTTRDVSPWAPAYVPPRAPAAPTPRSGGAVPNIADALAELNG